MTDRLGKLLVRGTDGSITDTPQNGPRLTDSVYVVDAWPPPERSTPLLEWLVEQNAIEGMGIEDGSADIAPA